MGPGSIVYLIGDDVPMEFIYENHLNNEVIAVCHRPARSTLYEVVSCSLRLLESRPTPKSAITLRPVQPRRPTLTP